MLSKVALKRKRSVSSVIGAVLLFAMLITVGSTYFYVITQDQSNLQKSIAQNNNNFLNGPSAEHLTVFGESQTGELAFYVNNTGVAISIVSYWILNGTSGGIIQYLNLTTSTNGALPFNVGQGQSADIQCGKSEPLDHNSTWSKICNQSSDRSRNSRGWNLSFTTSYRRNGGLTCGRRFRFVGDGIFQF